MKKILYTIMLFLICIGITNAAKCTVVTGSGKNIGDEIACGTEHFYVISNDGTNVKMLAKYNLLSGSDYIYIDFNSLITKDLSDVYKNENLKGKILEGYTIEKYNYSYDSSTKEYTITGVLLIKEFGMYTKTILFDEYYSSKEEALTSSEAKKVFEEGYKYEFLIENSQSQIIGISFEKDRGYEYKTIFVDKKNRTPIELMNVQEVKQSLEEGYRAVLSYGTYDEEFYGYNKQTRKTLSNCSSNCNYATYDYYFITLYKTNYSEYKSIILDSTMTLNEIKEYLNSNDEIQEILKEYPSYGYYFDGLSYHYGDNTYYGMFFYKSKSYNNEEIIKQDETAIGAHGDEKGNPEPIEIGVFSSNLMQGNWGSSETYSSGFNDYNYYTDSSAYEVLYLYYYTLKNMDYNVIDVDSMTVSELNEIVKTITGEEISLEKWYNSSWDTKYEALTGDYFYVLGSIKNLMPEGYEWLWSTTYWTRTADSTKGNIYFVDTLGDLCTTDYCGNVIGAGIRPVVTMSAEDIVYTITTKTDGNGTITPSAETEHGGNEVTFIATPNEGFELKEVKVTDSNGNTITLTDYKFTMPEANVVIEAIFVAKNPETSTINIMLFILLSIISIMIIFNFKKKSEWINN